MIDPTHISRLISSAALATLLATTPLAAQRLDAILLQGEEELALTVRADLLGVLFTDEAARDGGSVLARLDELGLERVLQEEQEQVEGGFVLVRARRAGADPAELLAEAQELRAENDFIAQAGYVARFEAADAPMIVTDEIVVQFEEGVEEDRARETAARIGLRLLTANPYMPGEYLAALEEPGRDTLDVSNELNGAEGVVYAHPNLVRRKVFRQAFVPDDALFANQWHHVNTGQNAGQPDADIDSDGAWGLTRGDAGTVIAVLDGGFDMTHPDLAPNYVRNAGEIDGNGIDDDGNGQIDDVRGWDFTGCTGAAPSAGCGDADPTGPDTRFGRHGTMVAGAAAARGDNAIGVSGACPECSILPVRIQGFAGSFADGLAIGYAWSNGADVITNSWGYQLNAPTTNNVVNAINAAATSGRGGRGSVVLFAMNTTGRGFLEDCQGPTPDISSPANVIAVGASSNTDQRTPSGYGDCMDLLGPTDNIGAAGGTLWGATTDMQGRAGYNDNAVSARCPSGGLPATPPAGNRDYTFCGGGTSFATPVVAGVAGLVISADPTLSRLEVQRILQDTADKIEPDVAAYDPETGFSAPTAAPQAGRPVGSTHGHGRVNAFEAVRLASGDADGRSGVDLVIRDNALDWGNTEQPSNVRMDTPRGFEPHWRSVDIKVDAPPYAATPTDAAAFDAFVHENPTASATNRVYVRVRNRGRAPAENVTVKLHWAFAGAGLPALPGDFWTAFPGDPASGSDWNVVGRQTIAQIPYSGASVAGRRGDAARIVSFDFVAPAFDPSLPNPDHYCLFVVLDSADDPVSVASRGRLVPDVITPRDNNVTHRNVSLQDAGRDGRFLARFLLANPFEDTIRTYAQITVPKGWQIGSETVPLNDDIVLKPGQRELVELIGLLPEDSEGGRVEVQQVVIREQGERMEVLGGIDVEVTRPRPPIAGISPEILELIRRQQRQVDGLLGVLETQPQAVLEVLGAIGTVGRMFESQMELLDVQGDAAR